MLVYDLETSFALGERSKSLIIEIGACKEGETFHRLVNPLGEESLRTKLKDQSVKKTMRWWRKLLGEKGYDVHTMDDIEDLLRTFTPQTEAIRDLCEFAEDCTWVAHNGKSLCRSIWL